MCHTGGDNAPPFSACGKTTRRRNCRKVCRAWKRIALYEALLNVRGNCRMYTVRLGHCGTSDLAEDPETGKRHQMLKSPFDRNTAIGQVEKNCMSYPELALGVTVPIAIRGRSLEQMANDNILKILRLQFGILMAEEVIGNCRD